jgi:hypothetical protein
MLGTGAGYLYARLSAAPDAPRPAEAAEFRQTVETYAPTCAQLRREGLHGPVAWRGVQLYVQTLPDYVYVIALKAVPDRPPTTWWWGAGRAAALEQACRTH